MHKLGAFAILTLTIGCIFAVSPTPAFSLTFKGAGKVINFTGNAEIVRAGISYRPSKGFDLYVGDTIRTHEGRVSFIMKDDSIMSLTQQSDFNIKEFAVDQGKRKGGFSLIFGKVRSAVSKSVSGGSHFTVTTPTAVAGVRGTEFVTGFDPATRKTEVAVLSGIVNVASLAPGLMPGKRPPEVNVHANQKTSVEEKKPPSPPIQIPKSELNQLKKSFEISKGEKKDESTQTASSGQPEGTKETKDTQGEQKEEKGSVGQQQSGEQGTQTAEQGTKGPKDEQTASPGDTGTKDHDTEKSGDTTASPNGQPPSPDDSQNGAGSIPRSDDMTNPPVQTSSSDQQNALDQQGSPAMPPNGNLPQTNFPQSFDSMNIVKDRMDITSAKIDAIKEQTNQQKSSTGNVVIHW